jgi:acyl carrier protein
MSTLHSTEGTAAAFPAAVVEMCIRDALTEQAATQAILRPPPPGATPAMPGWEPEIDSLAVIEIICSIEELLGVMLPASFAPRGGYPSTEICVQDLIKITQEAWVKVTEKENEHA